VQELGKVLGEQLIGTNTSRTFYTQQLLPTAAGLDDQATPSQKKAPPKRVFYTGVSVAWPSLHACMHAGTSSSGSRTKRDADGKAVYDHDLVRTDSSSQSLLKVSPCLPICLPARLLACLPACTFACLF